MKQALTILTFLTLCLSAGAGAQMRSTSFGYEDADKRFEKLLGFPAVQGNLTVNLSCFTQLQPDGKMKETGCYMKDQFDQPFAAAVAQAAKKGRLVPAVIDGKASRVWLQFRVNFIADGDDRRISLYLNPGYEENVKAYGEDHIAGTRAFQKKEKWMQICPRRANFAVWARAYLGEDGKADSVSVVHADGIMPTAACQDAIKQTILSSKYTPAYAEGVPVPSTYVEIFGN